MEKPPLFARLFQRHRRERTIAALYGAIVAQARQPVFFTDLAVPDTLEGRFEMVALHAWLVMRRLAMGGRRTADFNQALFDYMFVDMDFSLRELGASDMKIGDKVKDLASHYYGRVDAYDAGIKATDDPSVLESAVDRNLYGSTLPDSDQVKAMAAYIRRQWAHLESFPFDRLLAGEVQFAA